MYKCNKAVKKTAQIFCLKWYTMMMMMMTFMSQSCSNLMWMDNLGNTPLTEHEGLWLTYCFYPLLNSDGNRRKGFLTCPFENSIEWVALSEFCGLNINRNKSELPVTNLFFPSYWNFTLRILDSSVFLGRLLEVNEKRKLIN